MTLALYSFARGGEVMIGIKVNCARAECGLEFEKTTHNQKYCSSECCRIVTNAKGMEKYHEREAIRRGKKRVCVSCDTVLSRYNTDAKCAKCISAADQNFQERASSIIKGIEF